MLPSWVPDLRAAPAGRVSADRQSTNAARVPASVVHEPPTGAAA